MAEKNVYHWHVLKTISGCEQKLSLYFARKSIEHYCPFVIKKVKNGKSKSISVPLFPSYIFIYANESTLAKALKVKGVLHCMYWLNRPAVVSENEIKVIRQVVHGNGSFWLQQTTVDVHANVEITTTPHDVYENKNHSSPAHQLIVTLPSLGYSLFGEISHSVQFLKVGFDHVA